MKAFILAAGLGTRLKPWTLEHPKALVPVGGVPMLERVIRSLHKQGVDYVIVNVHHFACQIIDFLGKENLDVKVRISDESDRLLDTGGALLKASPLLFADGRPVIVHNVDILSDAPVAEIMQRHLVSGNHISLVTSSRDSSRKLIFGKKGELKGWHHMVSGELRPAGLDIGEEMHENAFSGIYIVSADAVPALENYSSWIKDEKFPIMDFLLHNASLPEDHPDKLKINEIEIRDLNLIDIGKPETLSKAESLFS